MCKICFFSAASRTYMNLISVCTSDVAHLAPGYLQLAALKYNVEVGQHFDRLNLVSASQLQQLLDDPHVASILPRVKTRKMSRPQTRAQTAASSNVPGTRCILGPGCGTILGYSFAYSGVAVHIGSTLCRSFYQSVQATNCLPAHENTHK